jgi:hypothetical protein
MEELVWKLKMIMTGVVLSVDNDNGVWLSLSRAAVMT